MNYPFTLIRQGLAANLSEEDINMRAKARKLRHCRFLCTPTTCWLEQQRAVSAERVFETFPT
jgi:hypothetical protein